MLKLTYKQDKCSRVALCFVTALVFCFTANKAKAQLSNYESGYFQNQYISNPAMAGLEKGLNFNLGYQQQTNNFPGQQKLQCFTADYNAGSRVGLGILVDNQQAGLISLTRAMATYAYHLPINESSKVNFGLSIGINDRYLDNSKVIGNPADLQIQDFNEKNVVFDGDIGISFTGKMLTIQAAIPNINSAYFKSDDNGNAFVDRPTFYTAASYKILLKDDITIEPKVALRGFKGFDDIFDAGFNLALRQYDFNVLGLYHTNNSETLGFGLTLKNLGILFTYTSSTSQLQGYSNNMFEAGVRIKLLN